VTDRLLSAALELIPELEAPRDERESPESSATTDTPTEAGGGPQPDTGRPQRSFWRRICGS
jgi:hypothetical protein